MAQSSVGSNSIDIDHAKDEVSSVVAPISERTKPLLEPVPATKKPRLTAREYRQEFARCTARMSVKTPRHNTYHCVHCKCIHFH